MNLVITPVDGGGAAGLERHYPFHFSSSSGNVASDLFQPGALQSAVMQALGPTPGQMIGNPSAPLLMMSLAGFVSATGLNGRFDEALAVFTGIVSGASASTDAPPGSSLRGAPSGRSGIYVPFDPIPVDVGDLGLFGEATSDGPSDSKNPLSLLAFALGAQRVTARPSGEYRLVDEHGVELTRGFLFEIRWPSGEESSHSGLSFGQKRLLAFLWHLGSTGDRPIIADELTNGLHSKQVRLCLDTMAGRQHIHAVQNPLLVNMAGWGTAEEIQEKFVLARLEFIEGKRVWRWRNPTAEEAAELYSALEARVQPMSEILEDQGLW